jgi:CBS domain-containing protein
MSRSKEGFEQNTSTQEDQSSGQEGSYNQQTRSYHVPITGRESRRDYPRRSNTSSNRNQSERNQQTTGGYERQRSTYRSDYNQPGQYGDQSRYSNQQYGSRQTQQYQGQNRPRNTPAYPYEYANRQSRREDTGDLYSQGIRQATGSQQYNDPYRTYERGSQYGQSQGQPDYDRNRYTAGQRYDQYNRDDYENRQRETYERDNRQYRDEESRRYRNEENRDYRVEPQYNRESYQNQQYGMEYQGYPDRVDPATMQSLEYGYAYGYPFGLPWQSGGETGYRRETMRCRDIMTKDVTTCTPETTIRQAADKLEDENVGSLPVVENGRLIGIVTDRDIVCRVLAEGMDTRTATVREAMSEDIVTCGPDESVVEAIHKMGEHQIRRLPICDSNGRIRGIISLGDLALEAENDQEIAKALEHISEATPYQSRRR